MFHRVQVMIEFVLYKLNWLGSFALLEFKTTKKKSTDVRLIKYEEILWRDHQNLSLEYRTWFFVPVNSTTLKLCQSKFCLCAHSTKPMIYIQRVVLAFVLIWKPSTLFTGSDSAVIIKEEDLGNLSCHKCEETFKQWDPYTVCQIQPNNTPLIPCLRSESYCMVSPAKTFNYW